jgi:hypothetical protein
MKGFFELLLTHRPGHILNTSHKRVRVDDLLNNTIGQDNGPRTVSAPVAPSKKKAPASLRLGKVSPALKKDVAVSKFLDSPAPHHLA